MRCSKYRLPRGAPTVTNCVGTLEPVPARCHCWFPVAVRPGSSGLPAARAAWSASITRAAAACTSGLPCSAAAISRSRSGAPKPRHQSAGGGGAGAAAGKWGAL
ncbi:MAG: hypothetical protein WDN04_25160 [Rhodospirillales bacterium]